MIIHLAAFTWKPGVTPAQVAGLTRDLQEMAAAIPEVRHYTCGPALRIRDGAADFGVVAVLAVPEDVGTYLGHPLHAAVQATWIDDMVADRRALQLPLPEGFLGR